MTGSMHPHLPETIGDLVVRLPATIRPDPCRVVARLFLPGQEGAIEGSSRAAAVVRRCLALSEAQVRLTLDGTLSRFSSRHRDLEPLLLEHFESIAHRLGEQSDISPARRLLVGACFTQEYAFEAAALFNPSIVAHPDQVDVGAGELRFVMSARAVGEGHHSSLCFRTGVIGPGGRIAMDPPVPYATVGRWRAGVMDRELVRTQVSALDTGTPAEGESVAFVLNQLAARFTLGELETALEALHLQRLTRVHADRTAAELRRVATDFYELAFPPHTELGERVVTPGAPVESNGIEDARFVQFIEHDGSTAYRATYTAFDGTHVTPRLLRTSDFRTFSSAPFTGSAAANKGMALFPRRIHGRYLALSRWDRESNALATSRDGLAWSDAATVQVPRRPWELIQLGNCGSPVETSAGWLVLTHGVGPMREYAIGAILLDLDDPTRVIAALPEPLITPRDDERDGYVPNVVYSCGGLVHEKTLVLPYGCSDSSIRFATIDLPSLLRRLLDAGAGS
jgi:predicted GH43/DUF377 family glycosyl hydrolase